MTVGLEPIALDSTRFRRAVEIGGTADVERIRFKPAPDPLQTKSLGRCCSTKLPRTTRFHHTLEPHVGHTSAIPWQIIERIKPVEVINRQISDLFWLRQSEVDRGPVPIFVIGLDCDVMCYATAIAAKMKVNSSSVSSAVRRCVAGYPDVMVDMSIRP